MELWLNVDEADISKVKPGQRVTFQVHAYRERHFYGVLREVHMYSKIAQAVVTHEVVASLKNPELLLKLGMTAVAEIEVEKIGDALLVPSKVLRVRTAVAQKHEWAPEGLSGIFMPSRPPLGGPPVPERVALGRGVLRTVKDGKLGPVPVKGAL